MRSRFRFLNVDSEFDGPNKEFILKPSSLKR